MIKEKIKVVSLFSGCGGLDLGFHRNSYNVLWANDSISDFCETHKINFGGTVVCAGINDVDMSSIPKADVVIGGPPCQSFSLAGKRRGLDDERGMLIWSYLEVLKNVKPKFFLFENVTGIKSAKNDKDGLVIDDLKAALKKLGYTISIHTLNAADYGVPQRRKRVFVVGNIYGLDIPAPKQTHSEDGLTGKKWVTAGEALSDLPSPSEKDGLKYKSLPKCEYQVSMRKGTSGVYNHYVPYASKKDMQIIKAVRPGGNYMDVPDDIATKRILRIKETGGRTTTYGRLHLKKTPYTINTHFNRPNVGCNIHFKEDRLITIREGLRIQSFPDWFVLHSSNKKNYYTQVGNAVPPLLADAWAKHLKKYFNKE